MSSRSSVSQNVAKVKKWDAHIANWNANGQVGQEVKYGEVDIGRYGQGIATVSRYGGYTTYVSTKRPVARRVSVKLAMILDMTESDSNGKYVRIDGDWYK